MARFINALGFPWNIVAWAGVVAGLIFLIWLGRKINRIAFKKLQARRPGIHLAYFEKLISLAIIIAVIIFAASLIGGAQSIWRTLLGGTAVVSAVLAFAAQDIIKDILAGMMISLNKPFEIGDRIALDDGTSGKVENITPRHVVLIGVDSVRYVIPNSKINAQRVTNYSFDHKLQSAEFFFSVGYDSNMDKVKKVIADAVEHDEYARPGIFDGECWKYAPVYFREFQNSSLKMSVLVYFSRNQATTPVIDSINTGVREALIRNGIEIPYDYINVVSMENRQKQ